MNLNVRLRSQSQRLQPSFPRDLPSDGRSRLDEISGTGCTHGKPRKTLVRGMFFDRARYRPYCANEAVSLCSINDITA